MNVSATTTKQSTRAAQGSAHLSFSLRAAGRTVKSNQHQTYHQYKPQQRRRRTIYRCTHTRAWLPQSARCVATLNEVSGRAGTRLRRGNFPYGGYGEGAANGGWRGWSPTGYRCAEERRQTAVRTHLRVNPMWVPPSLRSQACQKRLGRQRRLEPGFSKCI